MSDLGKVEFLGSSSLEDVQHITACGFEVCGRIVWTWDEDLRIGAQVGWLVNIVYFDESKNTIFEISRIFASQNSQSPTFSPPPSPAEE